LEKYGKDSRLAAEGWNEDWKILISILLSARTNDKVTIPVADKLFRKFNSLKKLSNAEEGEIAKIIRTVNFYKTKSRNVKFCCGMLIENYGGKVPREFEKLIQLPGVGRKTANVFLAEIGRDNIGVDTHVSYISQYLGWTKSKKPEQIEKDLERLFPRKYWKKINEVLVRFGQTYTSRKEKNKILDEIKFI
jgi:endonuclease-3